MKEETVGLCCRELEAVPKEAEVALVGDAHLKHNFTGIHCYAVNVQHKLTRLFNHRFLATY